MLRELYIENLAVIEKASIEFKEGLNIFTGETGSGKSILIGGINSVLGQRTSKDIVRSGCKKALITAVFSDVSSDVLSFLSDNGMNFEPADELIISREISSDGKSAARINQRPVSASFLKELGVMLVNVHGQHDSQILLSPQKHIDILDQFGNLEADIESYKKSFRELQNTAKQIKTLSENQKNKVLRIRELNEIVNEISSLDLKENEDEEIEEEFNLSNNAVVLGETLKAVLSILDGNENGGVSQELLQTASYIDEYVPVFSDLEPLYDRLNSAKIEIDDISSELNHLLSRLDVDPKRFEFISQRRDDIIKIKKKYGPSLDDVFTFLENAASELETLTSDDNDLERLLDKKNELLKTVSNKARTLSKKREQTANRLIGSVTSELEFLNMPNVKFVVKQQTGKLTIHGMDQIEFLISANLGEEPKPIAKIASGGELSRIMLALKSVLAEHDEIPTMIFDEIDSGVSGRAAQKIGVKLKEISKNHQVICVTHLAQIAVFADNHILIEKFSADNKTVTELKTLDNKNDRLLEIARIMSGDSISEATLESARNMIDMVK